VPIISRILRRPKINLTPYTLFTSVRIGSTGMTPIKSSIHNMKTASIGRFMHLKPRRKKYQRKRKKI
jgi:hypothetical protein